MLTILLSDYYCHSNFTDEKKLADKGKINLDQGHIANKQHSWDLNFCLTLKPVLISVTPYISLSKTESLRKLILLVNYVIIKIE